MPSSSRIARGLGALNWTQVAVDLALLIVGVLIALSIDGWIQDRRDAREEREYLLALVLDLERNIAVLDDFQAFEARQVEDGVLAHRALGAPAAVVDREAASAAMYRLTNRRTVVLARPTYSTLSSTGDLRLIRNRALRNRIVEQYEANERITAVLLRNNQFWVDELYAQYVVSNGLVRQRLGSNVVQIDDASREFTARSGIRLSGTTADDRVWQIPADAPERRTLLDMVDRRTLVSLTALGLARDTRAAIDSLRGAVVAELTDRWPGRTASDS